MLTGKFFRVLGIVSLVGLTAFAPAAAATLDSDETLLEQRMALEAEQNPVLRGDLTVPMLKGEQVTYPLFAGADDLVESAFQIDPLTDTFIPAFSGVDVDGAAYDPDNDQVYTNNGSILYVWPVGSATVTELGTIMDPAGAALSMVGLAFYDGNLYGTRNIANEAVYLIDTTTLVATVFIDYDDTLLDCGGVSVDPNTGEFYCTSDDIDTRGLNRINLDGSSTPIAAYPDGQTDIDGLAVSDDGFAYLVIDQPGSIYVYDFGLGTYVTPLTSPFTGSYVFSGGAWIYDAEGPRIDLNKTVGTVPAVCAGTDQITVPYNTDVYYCYEVTNIGTVPLGFHSLEDDQLGALLTDVPVALNPGDTYQHIEMATITAPVVNTGTWTATDAPPGYAFDDTVPFQFVDISATGTGLALSDDGEAGVVMPFSFTFYGVTSTDVCVGNNGGLIFGSSSCSISFSNASLPSSSVAMGILPFWDDLSAQTGDVYYETIGTAPNRQFVVQWHMRPHYDGIGDATLQVILYEGSNEILFQYQDVDFGDALYDFGASATVGLNQDASVATQYSYNTAAIDNGLAIVWTPTQSNSASDSDTAEVLLADPNIDVTPPSLFTSQMTGTTTVQALNIGNTGDGVLNWTIQEDNGLEGIFPPMGPAGSGNVSLAEESRFSEPPKQDEIPWVQSPPVWDGPDQIVLFDNGPLVNSPGTGAGGADESQLQVSVLGMNTLGFGHQLSAGNRIADDFQVTDPAGWFVETITFFAYQTGSTTTSTMTGVNLQIWDGPPDDPASAVVWGDTTTNVMTSTSWSNIYRVTDTTSGDNNRPIMANEVAVNTTLVQGTYWLDWQTDGTLASGPWAPPITITGTAETGNALQYTGTWAAALDTGTGTPQQGFPYIIEGTGQPACQALTDIPWLSTSVTSGSTLPAASEQVDVTFDSTGLPVALYEANLCVYSDDPDPGPGNGTELVVVPVTMEVVIPVELQSFTIE